MPVTFDLDDLSDEKVHMLLTDPAFARQRVHLPSHMVQAIILAYVQRTQGVELGPETLWLWQDMGSSEGCSLVLITPPERVS